jgi:hypothetical protein
VEKFTCIGAGRLPRDNPAMVYESFALAVLATVVTAIVVVLLIRDPRLHQPPVSRWSGARRPRRHARRERPRHRRAA